MDDELNQLEAELKRLRPAEPSVALTARVEHGLASEPVRRPLAAVRWIWAVALPVAAAVALVLYQLSDKRGGGTVSGPVSATVSAASTPLKPVAAENVLISAADEGLVTLDDGTPARRERLQFVDTITWKNPRTNSSLTWSVPREEVRVVPVSFQ